MAVMGYTSHNMSPSQNSPPPSWPVSCFAFLLGTQPSLSWMNPKLQPFSSLLIASFSFPAPFLKLANNHWWCFKNITQSNLTNSNSVVCYCPVEFLVFRHHCNYSDHTLSECRLWTIGSLIASDSTQKKHHTFLTMGKHY